MRYRPRHPERGAFAGVVVCVLVVVLAFAYVVITKPDRPASLTLSYGGVERTGERGDGG
jgi:hypothetical protein